MSVEGLVRHGKDAIGYIIDDDVFRYVIPFSFGEKSVKTHAIANSTDAIEDFLRDEEGEFKHVNHPRNWSDGKTYVEFDEHKGVLKIRDMYDRKNEIDFIKRFLCSEICRFFTP